MGGECLPPYNKKCYNSTLFWTRCGCCRSNPRKGEHAVHRHNNFRYGGTSTDVALVSNDQAELTPMTMIDGLPVKTPVVDIVTVGLEEVL